MFSHISDSKKQRAIRYLVETIPTDTFTELADVIREGGPNWGIDQHFGAGLFIRNVLRTGGFSWDESILDEIWIELAEKAVTKKMGSEEPSRGKC